MFSIIRYYSVETGLFPVKCLLGVKLWKSVQPCDDYIVLDSCLGNPEDKKDIHAHVL